MKKIIYLVLAIAAVGCADRRVSQDSSILATAEIPLQKSQVAYIAYSTSIKESSTLKLTQADDMLQTCPEAILHVYPKRIEFLTPEANQFSTTIFPLENSEVFDYLIDILDYENFLSLQTEIQSPDVFAQPNYDSTSVGVAFTDGKLKTVTLHGVYSELVESRKFLAALKQSTCAGIDEHYDEEFYDEEFYDEEF